MGSRKILLINPSLKTSQDFNVLSRFVPIGAPLAIGCLAAYLAEKKIDFDTFDERLEHLNEEKIRKLITEKNVGIVGISCATPFIYRTLDLARAVKRISGDIKVVLGGVHPTIMPEECLSNEHVDFVVRGEGEHTLYELIRSLEGQMDLKEVNGVSYKTQSGMVHNPPRALIEDLDSLPLFPFHLFKAHRDRYNFRVLSSRGCPYSCIFCSARSVSGRKYRYRGAENVVKEIEVLINEFGFRRIGFADDTFTADKKRTINLCELMMARQLHTKATFYCMARGDTVDRELLEVMKATGFRGISFGIETGSARIMKLARKGETIEQNVAAVRLSKELGFNVRGSFVLGLPTETREETLETINLALKIPLDFAMFNLPIPYPGTQLHEIAKKEGCRYVDFSNFDALEGLLNKQAVYIPQGRTEKEMLRLQRRAYFRFYFRLSQAINFMKIGLPELDLKSFTVVERLRLGFKILLKLIRKKKAAPENAVASGGNQIQANPDFEKK